MKIFYSTMMNKEDRDLDSVLNQHLKKITIIITNQYFIVGIYYGKPSGNFIVFSLI